MSDDPNYPVYLGAQHGLTYERGYKDGYTDALARMAELAEIAEGRFLRNGAESCFDMIPDEAEQ